MTEFKVDRVRPGIIGRAAKRRFRLPALILAVAVSCVATVFTAVTPAVADSEVVYESDFSAAAGSEWSQTDVATSPSGERFLGQFQNGSRTLTIPSLPPHSSVSVSFDLYLIDTWDGSNTSDGPDVLSFGVQGASPPAIVTTFSNVKRSGYDQSYPDSYPSASAHPAGTGASGLDTLGYPPEGGNGDRYIGDSTYQLQYTATHTDGSITLMFSANGIVGSTGDERWGVDNVRVTVATVATTDFDWTVPTRFGVDENRDGLVDYTAPDGAVPITPPAGWRVDFVAEDSTPCDASRTREWRIDGTRVIAADVRAAVLSANGCEFSYLFPAEGSYSVQLDVKDSGGASVGSTTRAVVVQDWLIVSLGDSVSSGEGNPDIPGGSGAQWENRQCHRSALAGPALAAATIEDADAKTSVTFLHLACSGATMTAGVVGAYEGQEPDAGSELPPQVDQMAELIGDREVDAVTLTVGANDVNFSDILQRCLLTQRRCDDATRPSSMATYFNFRLPALAILYDTTATRLRLVGIDSERVYLADYFDPTRDETGAICDGTILADAVPWAIPEAVPGAVPSVVPGITADEATWASDNMMPRLNAEGAQASIRNGWSPVGGMAAGFRAHGYCSSDRWVVTYQESLALQDNRDGTIHPNGAGHVAYGIAIATALTADFYVGTANLPRPPG